MNKMIRPALACALIGMGCLSIGLTASGVFFVGATAMRSAASETVISDSDAGYDQAAFDACVDSDSEGCDQ